MSVDLNDLAYWFPPVEAAGLHVPKTRIVKYDGAGDLSELLDGVTPNGYDAFLDSLAFAGDEVDSWPCFLRTGHTSGKHRWGGCCHLVEAEALPAHVTNLVEESHMGIPSLPTDTWAVRELIPTDHLFHCSGFGGLPVTREFRVFVRDDRVEHVQPYWPADALKDARPNLPHWRRSLQWAAKISNYDLDRITERALAAVAALDGGYWSVDFLIDEYDEWWLIDMAEGDRSFRYDP